MGEPLANGHDKAADTTLLCETVEFAVGAVSTGSVVMQEQIALLQRAAARNSERMTVEALAQDATRRLADAYRANDWQRAAEITREICRLEIYLSKRGFV
jgi:hypothetical protein